jgi:hypothetical protein
MWAAAAAEGNIELFYRHVEPSMAVFIVDYILILNIRSALKNDPYTHA